MRMIKILKQVSQSKGAVTVYLCIILLCVFTVLGVLTDAARIIYAENRVNAVLESSVSSVLAGYDSNLISDCGIFALDVGSKKAQEEYLKYLHKNLVSSGSFCKYEIDHNGTQIKGFNRIAGDLSLKNQIIDYMKYRVPLSAARQIIDRFKQAGLPEKAAQAEKAGSLRKDRTRVINTINSLNEKVREVNAIDSIRPENCDQVEQKLKSLKSCALQAENQVNCYTAARMHQEGKADTSAYEFNETGVGFSSLYGGIDANLKKIVDLRQTVIINSGKKEVSDDISAVTPLKEEPVMVQMNRLPEISRNEPVNNEQPPADDGSGKNAAALLNGFYSLYKKYSTVIDSDWLISDDEIKKGEELDHNMVVSMEAAPVYQEAKAEAANDSIISFVKKLVDKVQKAAESGMENVYINEYIMGQFSYVTSKQNLGHFLEKGEVEYILFRSGNQLENIEKMAETLTFLRFAINSLDYFINSANPHPVYRLIYAMARGLLQTGRDMLGLYRGKEISLTPSSSKVSNLMKMDYSDYLRLFLLLQPENDKLNGIKQLVQLNMRQSDGKFRLTDYCAAVNAKIRVKLNLWFIPLLIPDKLKSVLFEGKSFVIKQQIYKGY